ncbi:hypothetical protein [Streptomyces wedmorensis]|uniref:hypothetical protein n=1 Tax=Streptomyces wedmorensis TaxID=43759 RepID=UPI0037A41546
MLVIEVADINLDRRWVKLLLWADCGGSVPVDGGSGCGGISVDSEGFFALGMRHRRIASGWRVSHTTARTQPGSKVRLNPLRALHTVALALLGISGRRSSRGVVKIAAEPDKEPLSSCAGG